MSVDRTVFPNCTTINVDKPCTIKIYYNGNVTVTQASICEEDKVEAYQKIPQNAAEDDSLLKAFFKLHPVQELKNNNFNQFIGLKKPETPESEGEDVITTYNKAHGVDIDAEFVKFYVNKDPRNPKAGVSGHVDKKDEDLGNSFVKMKRPANPNGVIPESGNAVLEEYYLSEAVDMGKKPATPVVPLALDSFSAAPCVDVKEYMNNIMSEDMMKKFDKPSTEQRPFKEYVKTLQTFNRKTLSDVTKRYFKTFDKLERISNEMQHEYHTPARFEELFATHLTLGYEIAVLKNIMQKIKSAMDAGSIDFSDVINYIKDIVN